MELRSLSRPSGDNSFTRRLWLLLPVGFITEACDRSLPDPSENGSGELVTLVLFTDSGHRLQTVQVRKLVKSLDEWRNQLSPEPFAITRQRATEFAFHNLYWNNHKTGLYRCVCCGNAVFRSEDKFDSDTGWPSFIAAIALENITTRADHSLGMERTEVLCVKCDAHLGHLFDDGPAPTHNRYCLNSATLQFISG